MYLLMQIRIHGNYDIISTLITIYLPSEIEVFVIFNSSHNVLKSTAFVSGGVKKDLDSKHYATLKVHLVTCHT
jgi:hypothetical protein